MLPTHSPTNNRQLLNGVRSLRSLTPFFASLRSRPLGARFARFARSAALARFAARLARALRVAGLVGCGSGSGFCVYADCRGGLLKNFCRPTAKISILCFLKLHLAARRFARRYRHIPRCFLSRIPRRVGRGKKALELDDTKLAPKIPLRSAAAPRPLKIC